ncbi:MAG: BLUF domain-containing protein [Bacteroidota bacterium]
MLIQLVYASSAARPLNEDDLADILRASRRNNEAAGLTGVLLFSGSNFMQVLEGPAERVDETFRRVERDPRHRGVMVMMRHEITERAFPDWAMGCRVVPPGLGVRSLFDLTSPGPLARPTRAHRMLASFRRTMGSVA